MKTNKQLYTSISHGVKSPALTYPELVKKLARTSILIQELHDELTNQEIANTLGISKQAFTQHVAKARRVK